MSLCLSVINLKFFLLTAFNVVAECYRMFQNVPECMQIHELTCRLKIHELAFSSVCLHAVPWAYMKFHELRWSFMSLHAVSWACMQFLFLSEQLTRILQCLLSEHSFMVKSCGLVVVGCLWDYTVISWNWGYSLFLFQYAIPIIHSNSHFLFPISSPSPELLDKYQGLTDNTRLQVEANI